MLQMETGTEPPGDFRFCNGTHLDVAKLAAAAAVRTLVATPHRSSHRSAGKRGKD
jgi:hypothetical protein